MGTETNPLQATQMVGVDPQALELQRKRQLANLLTQQALTQQPQGQMVSGHYVAPSWTQNLANLANLYVGQSMQKEADVEQQQLAEALRKQTAEGMMEYNKLRYGQQGTPDVVPQGQTLRDDQGNLTYGAQQGIAPVQANPRAAFEYAMSHKSPYLQQMAMEMLKPQKLGPEETISAYNIQKGAYEPIATGATKEPTEYKEYLKAQQGGFKGSFFDYQMALKQAGAQPISISTGKDLSSQVGDIMKESKANTVSAYKTLNTATKIEQVANSPAFTGTFANVKMEAAKLADTLGFAGKDTQEKIANTRQGMQELGRLAVMASSNKGQGAVSDYERKLYERVAGGDISLTPTELKLVANAAKEAANYTIQQHQSQINYLKSQPEYKGLVPFYDVAPVNPVSQPKVIDFNNLPKTKG